MLRCLGRSLILLAVLVLVPLAYCRFTPADEFFVARRLMGLRQYAEAANRFETGMKRHPNSGMNNGARFDLGECYYRLQRHEAAAAMLQEAIDADRTNARAPKAQMTVGRCLVSAGEEKEALQAFARIRERYPEHKELAAEAEFIVSGLYLDKGDLPGAAKHARVVVADYPTSKFAPRAQLRVGDILAQKEANDRALEAYQKVVDDYPETKEAADAQFRIAKIHYSEKSYKESLGALRDALSVVRKAYPLNTKVIRDIRKFISMATDMLGRGGDDSDEAGK